MTGEFRLFLCPWVLGPRGSISRPHQGLIKWMSPGGLGTNVVTHDRQVLEPCEGPWASSGVGDHCSPAECIVGTEILAAFDPECHS